MHPSEAPKFSHTGGSGIGDTSKEEHISSCMAKADSKGHLVKPAFPKPSTFKQSMPSSSHDLFDGWRPFHVKAKLNSDRSTSIRNISADCSTRLTPLNPELPPTPIIHHNQRTISSGMIFKPDDMATQELRDKLIQLAGIPRSAYQRQFPKLSGYDTRDVGSSQELEHITNTVKDIMLRYQLLDDREFKNYLKSRNLPEEMFSSDSFMWNIPQNLLDIVVNYTFREDPILKNISFTGEHGYVLSYRDHEILKEHKPIRCELIRGVEIKYTHNEKPIIQQQATRGCTYAAAAMLMHQHNRRFSISTLQSTNLADDNIILQALMSTNLSPFKADCLTLKALANAVNRNGSAIVSVNSTGGGHTVIVDAVTSTFVLIRDPYHGWEVEISSTAFEQSWRKDAIQVK